MINIQSEVYCQDEFMTWQDKRVTNFELKILRVTKDTLFYKSFLRKKFYLTKDLIGYRYKDSVWIYLSDTVPDKIRRSSNNLINAKGRPAELFLVEDGVSCIKKISLIKISNDSIYYERFLKVQIYLMKDIIAYRLKKEDWHFVDIAYRNNIRAQRDTSSIEYKKRHAVLLSHAITSARLNQLNSVNNYAVYFHSDDLPTGSWHLKKDRYVALRLKSDSLGTLFVLPLVKIYQDSLYFDKNYFDWNSNFSISLNEISYICFDITFPSSQIPLEKRMKLESELTLLQAAYNSPKGFWLYSKEEKKKVVYSSVDIGY